MMLAMLRKPTSVFPTNCRDERRPPVDGKSALQEDSGVNTAKLQLLNREVRINSAGSKKIENIPDPFVVAVETTFPSSHCSLTCAPCGRCFKNQAEKKRRRQKKRILGKTGVAVPLTPMVPLIVQNNWP